MDESLARAITLAGRAHAEDRWGDYPYMVHLALVAVEARAFADPRVEVAAWLHDVIEDHPEYADEVAQGFPDLYESLLLDSRRDDQTYEEYIDTLIESQDPLALAVKYCDLRVNAGNQPPERLASRYRDALAAISEHIAPLGAGSATGHSA